MNEKQHTPAPWINDGNAISAKVDPKISETYIAPICFLDDEWAPAVGAANARLIAAAPELLACLVELSDYVFDEYTASHPLCERAAEARAVIAKATGEVA